MWYGVGAMLARHFPREEMTVLPQPGAFSLAAARLGWPLAECAPLSLHGRPLDSLRLHLAPGRRLLLLSRGRRDTRERWPRCLPDSAGDRAGSTVFEHLGGRARSASSPPTAGDWGERRAADLNTIALECRAGPGARALPRLAGLPDDAFEHDGQLTKREIRAATLAALAPLPGETLWDVGAGCGSIAIEWLRADPGRRSAIAIERDPARAAMIARNAAALGVPGSAHRRRRRARRRSPVCRRRTRSLSAAASATRALLPRAWAALRPGGRLVANVVSLEGERALLEWHGATRRRR